MRTNRTTRAAVLSIALVLAPGVGAAQSADEEPAAVSHWTSSPTALQSLGVSGGPQGFFDWGYRTTMELTGTVDADDSRASGDLTMVIVMDFADNGMFRGEGRSWLVNDDGTFEGTVNVIHYADGSEFRMVLAEGKDGYEGLSFAMTEFLDPTGEGQEQGLIWEGEIPPVPDASALPE